MTRSKDMPVGLFILAAKFFAVWLYDQCNARALWIDDCNSMPRRRRRMLLEHESEFKMMKCLIWQPQNKLIHTKVSWLDPVKTFQQFWHCAYLVWCLKPWLPPSLPGNWHSTDHILPKLVSCFVLTTQMRKASQDPKSKACWSVYAWQFKVNHSFKYLHFGPLYLPIQLLYTWPFVISRTCLSSFTKLP